MGNRFTYMLSCLTVYFVAVDYKCILTFKWNVMVTIREAKENDAKALIVLRGKLFKETTFLISGARMIFEFVFNILVYK